MFKKRGRKAKTTVVKRFFRSVISVVILTAFVLGISLFVKEIANFDPNRAVIVTRPIWTKLGISQDVVGSVAGAFAERISKTNISPSTAYKEDLQKSVNDERGSVLADNNADLENATESEGDILGGEAVVRNTGSGNTSSATTLEPDQEVVYKLAIMADSENNNTNLKLALEKAKDEGVHSVFFLGDYTSWGSVQELTEAKKIMDSSGMVYYSLPGDHDLGESVGPANYNEVFYDSQERVVTIKNNKFVMLDNSANKTLINEAKMNEFSSELADADFVFLSQPLYHHASPSVIRPLMGYLVVDGEMVETAGVRSQALEILSLIRNSSVRAVIAADHHSFSISQDEMRDNLMHVVVGSITDDRAYQGKTSITILSIYKDGTYSVQEKLF